ncbi:MAG: hypothetical protein ACRDAM_20100, partial [Casimicrobium sp.]
MTRSTVISGGHVMTAVAICAAIATIALSPLAQAGGDARVSATATAKGLCAASEHTYFACQTTRSKKWVSVCGTKADTLRAGGALQYRFGASPSR